MLHPATELRKVSDEVGYGVFATERIARGTIIWVRDALDIVLSRAQVARLPEALVPTLARYAYRDAMGRHILCWDHARYMNHSCVAATLSVGTLCDFARRDIEVGEEITCDYAFLNMRESFDCRCGAPACRGFVSVADLDAIAAAVDREVEGMLPRLARLPQLLEPFMVDPERGRLEAVLAGDEAMPSCRENRYEAPPAKRGKGEGKVSAVASGN